MMKAKFFGTIKYFLISAGILFTLFILLAFTSLPFWMRYHLATAVPQLKGTQKPAYIVMLGAGGMPEGENLVRLYHTAAVARTYPAARVILSLPGDTADSLSAVSLLKKELILHKIPGGRIILENRGNNTRNEVLDIRKMMGDTAKSILVVTSPEHVYRAVKCFRKAGFRHVFGHPAFEKTLPAGLLTGSREKGTAAVPEIGDSIQIRYRFWAYLHCEITVLREYVAITYYWLKGWI
jgi:uncharacterized SAM-binding protein YcdF (DUF218 family)